METSMKFTEWLAPELMMDLVRAGVRAIAKESDRLIVENMVLDPFTESNPVWSDRFADGSMVMQFVPDDKLVKIYTEKPDQDGVDAWRLQYIVELQAKDRAIVKRIWEPVMLRGEDLIGYRSGELWLEGDAITCIKRASAPGEEGVLVITLETGTARVNVHELRKYWRLLQECP